MATQNAQMAHKVEVVDEVKTRLTASTASIVSEYRGLTVAEMAELRHALARGRRRLQDLQEHARAPGHRRRRVPAAGRVPERPECADLRPGRHQRGGQGAARLLAGQPPPRHQGRAGRRLPALDLGPGCAGRPAAPRGPAGPLRRRAGGAAAEHGRPAQGAAAEPGLRDLGADRGEGRRRRGPLRPRRRSRRRQPQPEAAEAAAPEATEEAAAPEATEEAAAEPAESAESAGGDAEAADTTEATAEVPPAE